MEIILPKINLMRQASIYFKEDIQVFLKTDNLILKKIFCDFDLHWSTDRDEEIKRLSKNISLSEEDITSILNVSHYIFSKLKNGEITFDAINEDFKKLEFEKSDFTKLKDAYETYGIEFINKSNIRKNYRERLYEGSNRLEALTSKLNYRVINDENKKILDLIPVIEFTIDVKSYGSDKEKSEPKTITYTATEKDFDRMMKTLEGVREEFRIASGYLKGLKR